MKVFRLPNKDFDILFENNTWGFLHNNEFIDFSLTKNCLFLLPILEMEFRKAKNIIEKECAKLRLDPNSFPIKNIIIMSLESNSDHWTSCGLNWIESDIEPDKEIKEKLRIKIQNKDLDQKVRQRMYKIIDIIKKNYNLQVDSHAKCNS